MRIIITNLFQVPTSTNNKIINTVHVGEVLSYPVLPAFAQTQDSNKPDIQNRMTTLPSPLMPA